jgi:hypothetical protein
MEMYMASKKSPPDKARSQAQRLLEAARKARAEQSGQGFSRAMGKVTMARQARKTAKGQIGG